MEEESEEAETSEETTTTEESTTEEETTEESAPAGDDPAALLAAAQAELARYRKAEHDAKLAKARAEKDFEAERALLEQERDEAKAALTAKEEAEAARAKEAHRATLVDGLAKELGQSGLIADALLLKAERDGEDLATIKDEKGLKRLATRIKAKDPKAFKRPTGGSVGGIVDADTPEGMDDGQAKAFAVGKALSALYKRK